MRSRLYTKAGLYRFLSSIEAATDDFITVYVCPASLPDYMNSLFLKPKCGAYAAEIMEAVSAEPVVDAVGKYRTGAVILWGGPGNNHIVLPPFPIPENKDSSGKPDVSILHDVLDRRYIIGVVLVTWGWYALGIFDGDSLVECKTGTGYIHKQTKKGGRSQKRFARRTEEQKRDFLRRVGNRIEEKFGSYLPDRIFFGGNRLILKPLTQESRYLQTRVDKISSRILDVRYANREALVGSLTEITKSLVFTM